MELNRSRRYTTVSNGGSREARAALRHVDEGEWRDFTRFHSSSRTPPAGSWPKRVPLLFTSRRHSSVTASRDSTYDSASSIPRFILPSSIAVQDLTIGKSGSRIRMARADW